MSESLLARKGEAVPSGLTGGDHHAFAYAARRTIAFGHHDDAPIASAARPYRHAASLSASPRPAAGFLARSYPSVNRKRRFTFRLGEDAHERFCTAAKTLGCSRQKLLERALDHYLRAFDVQGHVTPATSPAVPRLV